MTVRKRNKKNQANEPTGLIDFQAKRKASSRENLLNAAKAEFCSRGYLDVSVEEIAATAGVSRMTFYRHFSGKPEIASELFRQSTADTKPELMAICEQDFRDHQAVYDWLQKLFSSERERRQLLQVFIQVNVTDAEFTSLGHQYITELATDFGEFIPAFSISPDDTTHRKQWIEGWLLLYEILDQGNHAARGSGVAIFPETIDILSQRFINFVNRYDAPPVN